MFYEHEALIYSPNIGFTDDDGIYHPGNKDNPNFIKSIEADIQPYSADLLYKEYGYKEEVTKRMFCDSDKTINVKNLIKVEDGWYLIKKIIPWDEYMDVMLFERV
jgi:hypothetical protein